MLAWCWHFPGHRWTWRGLSLQHMTEPSRIGFRACFNAFKNLLNQLSGRSRGTYQSCGIVSTPWGCLARRTTFCSFFRAGPDLGVSATSGTDESNRAALDAGQTRKKAYDSVDEGRKAGCRIHAPSWAWKMPMRIERAYPIAHYNSMNPSTAIFICM